MLPDKWYQTLKFEFSDLIYCILIFFCGDALCGNDKLLTNNFQGKMWIIFGIFVGKSKFLMCYGVTIEISHDPILSSNDNFCRKLRWVC